MDTLQLNKPPKNYPVNRLKARQHEIAGNSRRAAAAAAAATWARIFTRELPGQLPVTTLNCHTRGQIAGNSRLPGHQDQGARTRTPGEIGSGRKIAGLENSRELGSLKNGACPFLLFIHTKLGLRLLGALKSIKIKSKNQMDKSIKDMNADELRAFLRLLIRDGKIKGMKSSETRVLKREECLEWIEEALGEEKEKSSPSSYDMDEIRKEIEKALERVSSRVNDVEEFMREALKSPTVSKRLKTIAGARSGNPVVSECLKYYKAGEENETKLMLLSPPSFGKSHAVRELAGEYDLFLEHNCSKSIDELDTLVGGATPDNDKGGFLNVDGVLTQAVREAGEGKSTLLFFDECLRWREDTQAFLLTFLTGVKKDGELHYRLTTKKSSSGVLEVITCKAKFLHIICGANLTAEAPVRAFWSRFRKHRIEFTEALAKSTAKSIILSYGAPETASLYDFSEAYAKAMASTRELVKKGSLFEGWDFRCLEQAIIAGGSGLSEIAGELQALTPDHCNSWDMDLGDTSKDSISSHASVLDRFLKSVKGLI